MASLIAPGRLTGHIATLSLALAPVFAAVVVASLTQRELAVFLWPTLTGLGGLLLIFPQPAVEDWQAATACLALPAMAVAGVMLLQEPLGRADAIVFCRKNKGGRPLLRYGGKILALSAGFVGGAVMFAWAAHSPALIQKLPDVSITGICADSFTFFFSVLFAARVGPVRWSAQFLLIPLATIAEGIVILRPHLELRFLIGLALLGAGAWRLNKPQLPSLSLSLDLTGE